jgi:hypothetical protein
MAFESADEYASQIGTGTDPAQEALLSALAQIRQAQARPRLPESPLAQFGIALSGISSAMGGKPEPMLAQAMAGQEAALAGAKAQATIGQYLGQMAQQRQTRVDTQAYRQAQLQETQFAHDIQVQAEQRQGQEQKDRRAREASQDKMKRIELNISVAKELMTSHSPVAQQQGAQRLAAEMGALGNPISEETALAIAQRPPTAEQRVELYGAVANGVPPDQIKKRNPTLDPGYIDMVIGAIEKKDEFTLKTLGLPSPLAIEKQAADLALTKQQLITEKKKGEKEATEAKTPNAMPLLTSFNALSAKFIEARDAFASIPALAKNKTPTGAVSLVYAFARVNDPQGVVRDEDYQKLGQAGNLSQRVQNYFNKAITGDTLDDAQRADIVRQSRTIMAERIASHQHLEAEYGKLAVAHELPVEKVVPDHIGRFRGLTATPMAANAPPAVQTAATAQVEARRLMHLYPSLTPEQIKTLLRAAGWGRTSR